MVTIYRFRTKKSEDGRLEFNGFHRDATVLGYEEVWHSEKGWEIVVDALMDTALPVERRRFFLVLAGANLDPLGEDAFAYHVASYHNKGYGSYLFDATHLPEQLWHQLTFKHVTRPKPFRNDMPGMARDAERRRARTES